VHADKTCFEILMLLARPAAGKSEIIHYLKGIPLDERLHRFHVGDLVEIDDFPMLWAWFEEDEILARMGKPRLHTDDQQNFLCPYLWDVLIERIDLEWQKKSRDLPEFHPCTTFLVEFSRGSQHGGYASAFQHLSPGFAEKAAILYVDVPFEESLRKNRARFNPEKPDSILQHALSDEKLEYLYKETDWELVTKNEPNYIPIRGAPVPYMVLDNHQDLTTHPGKSLEDALEEKLGTLWRNLLNKSDAPA
jgi:hypothetical protein